MSLRQIKREKLREEIIKTSLDMFFNRGFNQTSIDDIATELEISKRTFFRYFPSKEDVVLSFYENLTENTNSLFKENSSSKNSIQAIRLIFDDFARMCIEKQTHFIKIEKLINNTPSIRARKIDKIFQCTAQISNSFSKAIKNNQKIMFKHNLILHFSMGVFMSAICTWVECNGKTDLAKIMNEGFGLINSNLHEA